MLNGPQIQAEATIRYLSDIAFHARVNAAFELAQFSSKAETGLQLSSQGESIARQTAAFALLMAEQDITPEVMEASEVTMREMAEKLGFQLVKADAPQA